MNIVALIPARAGSKRIPGKNMKLLAGKPLIQWTIDAATESGVFSDVVICSDDRAILNDYRDYPRIVRPPSDDKELDIFWVQLALEHTPCEAFAILRPTSPFRTAATIRRAFEQFSRGAYSSLRAVEPVKQHPGKMWQVYYDTMEPLIGECWPANPPGSVGLRHGWLAPWHSQPTQSLPTVYMQNSSMEMAWRWCVETFRTISGPKVGPFFTEGYEGFSIDYPEDWARAEALAPSLLGGVPADPPA